MKSLRKMVVGASAALTLASLPVSAAHAGTFNSGGSWFSVFNNFFSYFQGQIDPFQGQIDPFQGQIDPF